MLVQRLMIARRSLLGLIIIALGANANAADSATKICRLHAAPAASIGFHLTHSGTPVKAPLFGPTVIASVQAQGVYLGSDWSSNATTRTNLEAYLSSVVGSTFMSSLSPYGIGTGASTTGKTLSVTLPKYTPANPIFLLDSQIQDYLRTNFTNNTLMAPTDSTLHVVYVEPGVAVDDGSGATSIDAFLGYHSQGLFGSQKFRYAVMPFPGDPNVTSSSQGFASDFDQLTAVTSHEIAEAATDPGVGDGWLETVLLNINFSFGPFTFKLFSIKMPGEEIGDVPALLYDFSTVHAHLNGYLVQKMIAKDGTSLITPTGATNAAISPTGKRLRY